MRVVGLLCGIGTLLHDAEQNGYRVVGNIEVRSMFRKLTSIWDANFPNSAWLQTNKSISAPTIKDLDLSGLSDSWFDAELAIGHPPCGAYSDLGHTGISKESGTLETRRDYHRSRREKPGLVPLFIDLVKRTKPRIFAMDNLPKMLMPPSEFSEDWWRRKLPNYELTFLNILNWDYGSPQRRRRLWVVGVRGGPRFKLKPPHERIDGPTNAWEAIADLPWQPWINDPSTAHVHHAISSKVGSFWTYPNGTREQIKSMDALALGFLSLPTGYLWPYRTESGRATKKAGHTRLHFDIPSRVLTGMETLRHPLTGWALTIRERARLMGWSDDFKLWDGEFTFDKSMIVKLVKLTGKAVPGEFPRYLIPQLKRHLGKM